MDSAAATTVSAFGRRPLSPPDWNPLTRRGRHIAMERRLLVCAVTVALLAACGGASSSTTAAGGTLTGQVLAGPTCPVETTPPDPNCAPRPVVGAVLVVRDLAGDAVAEIISDGDGRFDAALPAGSYTLVPQPVDGLMGTGEPQDFTIEAGAATTIDVAYDTGIR